MRCIFVCYILLFVSFSSRAQILDKDKLLQEQKFWQNKDMDWYKQNIPFFDSPDSVLNTTYYYRWDMMTMHLIYGSAATGYTLTEFIDRPWWAGTYGAISCPAGHQLYELRWLRNPRYGRDFANYWLFTPGAQPRNYSNWLADGIWNLHKVHPDKKFLLKLEEPLHRNFLGWQQERWVESEGLFAWDGMHDGMETNINSRQTSRWFDGAEGYRPTLNSYMWADALAISRIAELSGNMSRKIDYEEKAARIKTNLQQKLWDPKRNFFFHRFRKDEENGIKANSLTYETGKFAGSSHGRELIGYIPWYFNMPDKGFESAWKFLMDESYFFAPFGPRTVEKNDPMYFVSQRCCQWSGNAWPFATSQTLTAMSNLIRNYDQSIISAADYYKMLHIYAQTHRKEGNAYIAEANHPETGSWDGHDVPGHSDHYFHSSFVDLVINGIMGIEPSGSDLLTVHPLIPENWDFACIDDIIYHGNRLSIVWDKTGNRYGKGKGFQIFVNGKSRIRSEVPEKTQLKIPPILEAEKKELVNHAVNNTKDNLFPLISTSFPGTGKEYIQKLNDGQYWYTPRTTNQWTTVGSTEIENHWCSVDFGKDRKVNNIKIYPIENPALEIFLPEFYTLEYWKGNQWNPIKMKRSHPEKPAANRSNTFEFDEILTSKIRVNLHLKEGKAAGLSEIEVWGHPGSDAITEKKSKLQAEASASINSERAGSAIDGLLDHYIFWSTRGAKEKKNYIQLDFNSEREIKAAQIYFAYDGVHLKAPLSYQISYLENGVYKSVAEKNRLPANTVEGLNNITFHPVSTSSIRITVIDSDAPFYSGIYQVYME